MVATVCDRSDPERDRHRKFFGQGGRDLSWEDPWVVKPSRGKRRARLPERATFREVPGSFLAPSIQPPIATMVYPLRP
jgi:hypothetical protein